MSARQVFSIANTTALPSWIMLAALPGRPWATKIVAGKIIPSLFAVHYAAMVAFPVTARSWPFLNFQAVAAARRLGAERRPGPISLSDHSLSARRRSP
jgi:hypothetical protein